MVKYIDYMTVKCFDRSCPFVFLFLQEVSEMLRTSERLQRPSRSSDLATPSSILENSLGPSWPAVKSRRAGERGNGSNFRIYASLVFFYAQSHIKKMAKHSKACMSRLPTQSSVYKIVYEVSYPQVFLTLSCPIFSRTLPDLKCFLIFIRSIFLVPPQKRLRSCDEPFELGQGFRFHILKI